MVNTSRGLDNPFTIPTGRSPTLLNREFLLASSESKKTIGKSPAGSWVSVSSQMPRGIINSKKLICPSSRI